MKRCGGEDIGLMVSFVGSQPLVKLIIQVPVEFAAFFYAIYAEYQEFNCREVLHMIL